MPGARLQPTLWRTCRVLANRKRLQIFALLARQPAQTVSAVARQMKLSLPAASQYLRSLEARGLLTSQRVGRRVKYSLFLGKGEDPTREEMVPSLRLVFRRGSDPIEVVFKLATAFTHPRRIEVFRAVNNGAEAFGKIRALTRIPARALHRHLEKLAGRGFVESGPGTYVVKNHPHPFGRVLVRLATRE